MLVHTEAPYLFTGTFLTDPSHSTFWSFSMLTKNTPTYPMKRIDVLTYTNRIFYLSIHFPTAGQRSDTQGNNKEGN